MTTLTKRQTRMLDQAAARGAGSGAAPPREPPAPTVQYIPLDQIRTDGGTQARAQLDEPTVEEYAETWYTLSSRQNGFDQMPPIVVYYDGSDYWLADGFHRVEAYKRFMNGPSASASQRGLMAEVRQGTRRDAVLYACGANAAHGLRRTNADKRRAVETLLRDEEWRQWSNRKIADACAVDHKTVADVRDQLAATGEIPQSTERQGADGRTTNTAGIAAANEARAQPHSTEQAFPLALRKRAQRLGAHVGGSFDITHQRAAIWFPDENTTRWTSVEELTHWCDQVEHAEPTDDQVAEMRARCYALGYEQFYRSDVGWTAYHPKTKKANYKTWADVEADIKRKEAMAQPRLCEMCGKPWGAPGSMVTSEGMLCPNCAAARLSSGKKFDPAPTANAPQPSALELAADQLHARGWQVNTSHAPGDCALRNGHDAYATDADGVIAAARILQEQPDLSPDALMEAVNALDDVPAEQPAAPDRREDHEIVATIREKAAALGLELAWEDDQVLLYWPDEVDDLDTMDGLSYEAALSWLDDEAPGIAESRAERAAADAIPHLPPPAEWKAAQKRAGAIGLRLEMHASGAFSFYRVSDQTAAGGAVDWPATLDLLARKEADRFRFLIEQIERLGATVNPTAYDDPRFVQVIPPKGYQQAPLKCDAADLVEKIAQWSGQTAAWPEEDQGIEARLGRAVEQAQHLIGLLQASNWKGAQHTCRLLARTMGVME